MYLIVGALTMTNLQIEKDLLSEILPVPSQTVVADRFVMTEQEAAACGGKCKSGSCKASA